MPGDRVVLALSRPSPATLLVLRALGLGDLLTSVPALRALADVFPDARRLLATPAGLAPLVGLVPGDWEVVDARPLEPLAGVPPDVDLAVNLHGRGPQSTTVLAAVGARRLVSWGVDGREWREDEHEVHRWCRLLRESGIPADPSRLEIDVPAIGPPGVAPGATVVHPGGAKPACRWPAQRWAAVAAELRARGERVVVTGGPDEIDLATAVATAAGLGPDAVLAGRTDLLTLAATIASCRRLVSADTGVSHLATAYGTPSVVLFGAESPGHWGPPADRPQHRALWAGTYGDIRGDGPDPGLLHVQVDQVLAAVDALPTAVSPDVRSG